MKLTALLAAAVLSFSAMQATASPLSDLADQEGLGWMMGAWSGAEGRVKVSYEWRVDKNGIAVKFEAGERTAEGLMALKPGTQEVHYMAVDNKGAISKGQWVESNGSPALKATRISEEGEVKTIAEHIKVDDNTMKVKVFKQDDSGNAGELLMELELKKK